MSKIHSNAFIHVRGNNFSGRSRYLKSLAEVGSSNLQKPKFIYLGEQPNNFITGIVPTVKNEIELHATGANDKVLSAVQTLFQAFSFDKHLQKNPFVLSGGEQAILTVLCNLLLSPEILAIDATIEQLNEEWRGPLLNAIMRGDFSDSRIYLSDNRTEEYGLKNLSAATPVPDDTVYIHKFQPPSFHPAFMVTGESRNIEIKNLSFGYEKNTPVISNANILLEPGNIYYLNGRNGAGKTTLAKLLTGLLEKQSGDLLVDGKNYNPYMYPGHLVGYSFQNPDEQLFSTTVEDEVLIYKKNEFSKYSERREFFIEIFGLNDVRTCHPAELPFVMRKRISLAATLANDRPWYILDEPTLGQDGQFVSFLVALLKQMESEGKGIIIITHSKEFEEQINGKNVSLLLGKIKHTIT